VRGAWIPWRTPGSCRASPGSWSPTGTRTTSQKLHRHRPQAQQERHGRPPRPHARQALGGAVSDGSSGSASDTARNRPRDHPRPQRQYQARRRNVTHNHSPQPQARGPECLLRPVPGGDELQHYGCEVRRPRIRRLSPTLAPSSGPTAVTSAAAGYVCPQLLLPAQPEASQPAQTIPVGRPDGTSSLLNLPGRRAARTIKLTEANVI
jgi:hypothetical protein